MKLEIEGMSCQHCVHAVRVALEALEGVTVNDVTIGSAEISVDGPVAPSDQITKAIAEEGYTVVAVTNDVQ